MFDTIVSLITPPLKGAVAVIRISGEKTLEIVQEILDNYCSLYSSLDHLFDNSIVKTVLKKCRVSINSAVRCPS